MTACGPGRAGALQRVRLAPRTWFAPAFVAAVLLACSSLAAFAQTPLEASVKAAYLFKFLAYVEWPSSPDDDSPLIVGVMGAEAVYAALTDVASGRRVGRRPLAIRRVLTPDALDGLHVLHVGREAPLAPAVRGLQRRPVLLVTDVPDGLAAGGVLNFVLIDGRVRFEASLAAAERYGLKLSSRLLNVAERVAPP
jgi:YfiR/HmsC-like